MALALGFPARDRDIGARGIDIDGGRGAGPQKVVVDGTDAPADLQHALPADPTLGERLDECPGQADGPLLAVGPKVPGGVAGIELAIERRVAWRAAVHPVAPPGRRGVIGLAACVDRDGPGRDGVEARPGAPGRLIARIDCPIGAQPRPPVHGCPLVDVPIDRLTIDRRFGCDPLGSFGDHLECAASARRRDPGLPGDVPGR